MLHNIKVNSGNNQDDIEAWLSLVERCVRDAEAASSNLVASILILQIGSAGFFLS